MTKAKILLVEDDSPLAKLIENTLSRLGHAVPAAVSTGEEAVSKAAELRPDLVLMDIRLGGVMDGVEAAQQIRAHLDVSVIYLTSKTDEETLERAKITEPDGYILKPFQLRELEVAVEIALYKRRVESRNRKMERWFATTLQTIGEGVIATDRDGYITFVNPIAEALTGWKSEEALGKDVTEVFRILDANTRAPFEHVVASALAEGVIIGLSEHSLLLAKDGVERPVDANSAVIRNGSGKVSGVVLVFRDRSERRRAEDALQESEQRFSAFMENLPGFAWMKDLEGRYVYLNKMLARLPAFRGDWVGKTDAAFWPFEIAAQSRANDQKVVGSKEALEAVEPYLMDNEQRYALVSKFPIFDKTGAVVMVGGASVDITERIQAEQALRKSEERFRQLAENITEVFWIMNLETRRTEYVSPAYEKIWKCSLEDLRRRPDAWMETIHPEDRERVKREEQKSGGKAERDQIYRIIWPDGSIRWIRDRGFPVLDESGAVVRIAGIAEDITETKEAAQALQQANEQLHILSRRLFQVQEDERRHLAREIHDQIGQTVTAAKISLQSAQQLEDHTAIAQRLEDGIAILDRLLQQTRQLSLDLRPPLLDDLGLVPALRWYLDQQAQRAGFGIEFFADPAIERLGPEIETASFRVAQEALTNIVRHARAEKVSVELYRTPDALHLIVRDDGVGFDVAGAHARARGGGSVGLPGMGERVSLVGGEFDCKSTPGCGTEVHAFFPFHATPSSYHPTP